MTASSNNKEIKDMRTAITNRRLPRYVKYLRNTVLNKIINK